MFWGVSFENFTSDFSRFFLKILWNFYPCNFLKGLWKILHEFLHIFFWEVFRKFSRDHFICMDRNLSRKFFLHGCFPKKKHSFGNFLQRFIQAFLRRFSYGSPEISPMITLRSLPCIFSVIPSGRNLAEIPPRIELENLPRVSHKKLTGNLQEILPGTSSEVLFWFPSENHEVSFKIL